MHTARCGLGTQRGTAIALLKEVGRKTGIAGPMLVLTGLLGTACTNDRLTEPKGQTETRARPAFSLTGCPGCLQDNFTDANGTPLGNHIPDGGSVPFAWQLTNSDPTVAQIQNNAVGHDQSGGWIYLTSVDAGDIAELEVDVFASPTVQTDVAAILRADPASPTFSKGYTVYWVIYGNGGGSDISIDRQDTNLLFQTFTPTPTSTGLHTFKAEILPGGVIRAYVDGVVAATVADPNPLPAGRAGMSLFNSGTPSSVRITSFVARPPCPPTGDPVLDDPTNLAAFDSSFQAGNPNGAQTDRKEHLRAGYKFPDGHVESDDLTTPFATNCSDSLSLPLTKGDGKLAWIWHSHPFVPHEPVSQCGQKVYNPPLPQYPAMPSDPDWMSLNAINLALFANGEPPIAGYIYDKEQWYRMNPNIPGQQPTDSFIHGKRSACR